MNNQFYVRLKRKFGSPITVTQMIDESIVDHSFKAIVIPNETIPVLLEQFDTLKFAGMMNVTTQYVIVLRKDLPEMSMRDNLQIEGQTYTIQSLARETYAFHLVVKRLD